MNMYIKKISAAVLAGALCLTVLGGCSSGQNSSPNVSEDTLQTEDTPQSDDTLQYENTPQSESAAGTYKPSLGEFSLQDVTGETYTNEMFQDYELTMINVFTTWCTPCIHEIPDLEKLYKQMEGQGVNIVGVVLDAVDSDGNIDEEAVEKAKLLKERTGAAYPFLIPDADAFNGRLKGIDAVPETFFVDKYGNITGNTYSGSNDLEGWKKIVEMQRDSLKGENP